MSLYQIKTPADGFTADKPYDVLSCTDDTVTVRNDAGEETVLSCDQVTEKIFFDVIGAHNGT